MILGQQPRRQEQCYEEQPFHERNLVRGAVYRINNYRKSPGDIDKS
jgi:hypothetical protein